MERINISPAFIRSGKEGCVGKMVTKTKTKKQDDTNGRI